MAREPPIVLPVVQALLRRANPWFFLLSERSTASRTTLLEHAARFAFKNDEKAFVVELLERKPNIRAYRCDQKRGCGDFVIVDVSSPDRARRRVVVVELKQRGRLRVGGAGTQLRNARLAVEAVAADGLVAPDSSHELVTGSREAVLEHLRA